MITARAAAMVFVVMLVATSPSPVWALCPNCLGQADSLTSSLRLVGLFLLLPPALFFAVAFAIRRLTRG